MVPWPLARFGAAAQLLGRPPADWLAITAGLGPELLVRTRVILGSDLESIGLATGVDASDPAAKERVANTILPLLDVGGRAELEGILGSASRVGLTVMMRSDGTRTYSIERTTSGVLDAIVARGGSADIARAISDRLGPLSTHVDQVIDTWAGAFRLGVHTEDRGAVSALLERSQIAPAQRSYFADTVAVWTKSNPTMTVRIHCDASGPLDAVDLSFRTIPAEHLVRIWRTFRPRPDLAQRIGAFVGAMGVEIADSLVLQMTSTGDPTLEATFVPADTPFARPGN